MYVLLCFNLLFCFVNFKVLYSLKQIFCKVWSIKLVMMVGFDGIYYKYAQTFVMGVFDSKIL